MKTRINTEYCAGVFSRFGYPLLSFLLPFAVYLRTLCPTVYTFDSAEFSTAAYCLGIIHATGYPLYLLLGKLFTFLPIGDIAYRMNIMSAFLGALTVVMIYHIILKLTRQAMVSTAAALLFAFSYNFWAQSVAAEVYTLHTFFMATLILALLSWQNSKSEKLLLLFAWIYGLSFANHMSTILLSLGFLYFVLATDYEQVLRPKILLKMLALFLFGLSFYLYLPLRYEANPPLNYAKNYFGVDLTNWRGLLWMVSGEMFREEMFAYSIPELASEVGNYLYGLWTDFVGVGLVMGSLGAFKAARERRQTFIFLLLLYSANVLFFINYRVSDKGSMFLSASLIWALWIGEGYNVIIKQAQSWKGMRWSTALSAFLILLAMLPLAVNFSQLDESNNWTVSEFAGSILGTVEPNAFIIGGWTSATPLEYLHITQSMRPDISIFNADLLRLALRDRLGRNLSTEEVSEMTNYKIDELIESKIDEVPVYLMQYDARLARKYRFVPTGHCYKLLKPGEVK